MEIRRSIRWSVSGVWPVSSHCRMAAPIFSSGSRTLRIAEEYYEKTYREATSDVEACARPGCLDGSAFGAILIEMLGRVSPGDEEDIAASRFFREEVSDEVFVNTLSTYLDCTPLEKQFLLEAEHSHQQARRLNDLIQFMLHERRGAEGWG